MVLDECIIQEEEEAVPKKTFGKRPKFRKIDFFSVLFRASSLFPFCSSRTRTAGWLYLRRWICLRGWLDIGSSRVTRALNSRPPVDLPSTQQVYEYHRKATVPCTLGDRQSGEEAYIYTSSRISAMAEPEFESEQPAVAPPPPALREPPTIRRTSSMGNPGATF